MSSILTILPGLYVAAIAGVLCFALAAWFERIPGRVIAVHAILIALVLGPHLFLGRTLLPVSNLRGCSVFGFVADTSAQENPLRDDLLVQQLPTTTVLRDALLRGELPFRDDTVAGGVPLWADQQAQVLQPVMLASLPFPPERALVVAAALRLLLALFFSFLFFRSVCGSETGALAGSIAFGMGGFVQLWLGWPLAGSAAWLPAVLYGIRRVCDSGRRRDSALLIAATFGLLTAGHPETMAYALAFALAWTAVELTQMPTTRRKQVAIAIMVPLAIGGALSAPVNIPTLQAIAISQRSILLSYRDLIRAQDAEAPEVELERLASVVAPDAYGNNRFGKYWGDDNINEDGSAYAGTAALLLGLLLLASRPYDRKALLLASGLLLCLLLISAAGPFGWIVRHAPVLSSSSSGAHRLVLLINWIVAFLVALAVARAERKSFSHVLVVVTASLLAIAIVVIYWMTAGADVPAAAESRRSTMLAVQLSALAITAVASILPSRRLAGAIIVITVAVELAITHVPATPPSSAALPPSPPLLSELREKAAGWRVRASKSALRPNLGSLHGIRLLEGYNPIAPAAWLVIVVDLSRGDISEEIQRDGEAWLDALGVRYQLLAKAELKAPTATALADARSAVIERPNAQPPLRFAGDVAVAPEGSLVDLLYLPPGESGRAIARHAASIRGRRTSWLLANPPRGDQVYVADASFWSDVWRPDHDDSVELLSRTPSALSFAVRTSGPRLLTTTEIDDGGWSAVIDGTSAKTERINGAFAGVRVPAGASRVELRYLPPGLTVGLTVGLAGLVAALILALRRAH